ncbi:tail fiber assembly protein [Type-D symbiont of Plautia stali]|uniref:tail fiber assembly protein n=1 Tax=Type-D symbiont of Plautia stali TaxID=1560356 RepID=UPI00073F32CE|nr:tail fiber assembly protein [Type-D symbiont of Plautia stali]
MADEKEVMLDEKGLAQSSGILTVYNFDPETGLYSGSSQEFLTQGLGIPAHSTVNVPPSEKPGQVSVFLDGSWQQVVDHRGETVYSTATGDAITVSLPGDYPAGTTLLKPATAFDKWGGIAWVTDTAAAQQAAIAAAEAEKTSRISEVGNVTQAWQTQLMLGIITELDKASLTVWMKYLQKLQAMDVSTAPDVIWPQRPDKA